MDDSPATPSTLSGFSPHALVPASEIERRLEAFQRRLAAAGVSGALIVQLADLVYLSGTAQDAQNDTPIVGAGVSAAAGKGASLRPIGRGEPVVVDLIGVSAGYIADQERTFSIGPLPRALAEAHDHAREILYSVAAAARPGVRGSQLYELAIERAGPRPDFMGAAGERAVSFVGHGVGLETDEYPFLARGWDSELEEV